MKKKEEVDQDKTEEKEEEDEKEVRRLREGKLAQIMMNDENHYPGRKL